MIKILQKKMPNYFFSSIIYWKHYDVSLSSEPIFAFQPMKLSAVW